MNDQLQLGMYQLARYMLTTFPNFDTLEGEERRQLINLRAALLQFIRATEVHYRLPRSTSTKSERRLERVG